MTIQITETPVTLVANNDTERSILEIIGTDIIRVEEKWDEDTDADISYKFPNGHKTKFVTGLNDDSWGAVVGAFNKEEDNKLVFVCDYGDEGEYNLTTENATFAICELIKGQNGC